MTTKYQIGDTVIYRTIFGRGPMKLATITGVGKEQGKTVYDLNDGHWAYEVQIAAVMLRA